MLTEQQKEWVRAIHDGRIRSILELIKSNATEVSQDGRWHFYVIEDDNMDRTRWYRLDDGVLDGAVNLLDVVHQFHALVHYLTEIRFLLVAVDVLVPRIELPSGSGTPQRMPTRNMMEAITYARQWSRLLINTEPLLHELYIPLPSLSSFIANNYRTPNQVEYEGMAKRAEDAERHARRATWTSIAIGIISIIVSGAAILTDIYGDTAVTTEMPLDIRIKPEGYAIRAVRPPYQLDPQR